MGRNARRNPLFGFDRDGERRLIRRAVELRHHGNLQLVGTLLRQGETNQPATMLCHEGNSLRRTHLRRNDKVALVFAVLGVREDEHSPVAGFLDEFFDRREIAAEHTQAPVRRAT